MLRSCIQGFLFFAALLNPPSLLAQSVLHVDEAQTRLTVTDSGSILKLAIAGIRRPTPVHVEVEMLGSDDRVIEARTSDTTLSPGSKHIDIPLSDWFSEKDSGVSPLWYRIRYRVQTNEPGHSKEAASGIISASELGAQPFTLRMNLPGRAVEASPFRVYVFARHPILDRPVSNVEVTATLNISDDNGEHPLKSAGRTNSSGYVAMTFDMPGKLEDPDAKITVEGRIGKYVQEISEDIEFDDRANIVLNTDKPIYQPGQLLRIRALVFDEFKRAVPDAPIEFKISNPEQELVYRREVNTSKFGEADIEWNIPANAGLGDYSIEVEGSDSDQRAVQSVKISRYDLPAFTVTPKPDRSYYLPNQNAKVEVRADYLFGRPVKGGHVKVVRESNRHWNFREQYWEIDEGEMFEGELDGQGRLTVNVDLQQKHDDLAAHEYPKYVDLGYAAYVTDTTTNRTEQRRFQLRLTKEPIHIYVKEGNNAKGLALEFYLSTSYADGNPAKSRVNIYALPAASRYAPPEHFESAAKLLRTISTNRYGVAKVTGLATDSGALLFTAEGKPGEHSRDSHYFDVRGSALRIETNKVLYRRGEALEIELRSSFAGGSVMLEVIRESQVVRSAIVRLHNGTAFTVIPYTEAFQDDVLLSAYYAGNSREIEASATRVVAYPRDHELKIDTHLNQAAYSPGDEVGLDFRVRTAEGLGQPSLLGVVVLDKAIEERARTDEDFGHNRWFCAMCGRWSGYPEEVGGLTRHDLDRLDLTQPVSDDLALAAELLLNSGSSSFYEPKLIDHDDGSPERIFGPSIREKLQPLKGALDQRFLLDWKHPLDEASLREILTAAGLDFQSFRDPWDNMYRAAFSLFQAQRLLELKSAGPDKRFDSPDDFTALRLSWPYFRPYGELINKATREYHRRTGAFIRDAETLQTELAGLGEELESWRDPWEQPYRLDFGIFTTHFTITVRSSGPNRSFEAAGAYADDFVVWTSSIDYTEDVRRTLDHLISEYYQDTKIFPDSAAQFEEALQRGGGFASMLLDPWMHRYYPSFKTEHYYADHVEFRTYRENLARGLQRAELVPVTSKVQFVVLRSAGPDGIEGTYDDFDVAAVSRVAAEQSGKETTPKIDTNAPVLQAGTGAIRGVVADITGARIPGVRITAASDTYGEFQSISGDTGGYLIRNLPPAFYTVTFELPGFRRTLIQDVPVRSTTATDVDATLEVGTVAQTVAVSDTADSVLATSAASVAVSKETALKKTAGPITTPRLREFFPETLLWLPALETDRSGRARVKFKLADNITTWKLAAIVSTEDGQIGLAEKEIVSFQPFFVDHDPPKTLTEGDEIALPVVVRSYLEKDQSVKLAVKPESWFAASDASVKSVNVKAGDTVREIFGFKAISPVTAGKHRITATGSNASDAIEKSVSVRPNGKEMTVVSTEILRHELSTSIVIPSDAIPHSIETELRVYPNLITHVVDGIEGILQRPHGCAEQTISSAYPNLLFLQYLRSTGNQSAMLEAKARRYLQAGLDRLRAYQAGNGGFTYWGDGKPDIAVTAYAAQFLVEAKPIASVDADALSRARDWLERQQREDGSWDGDRPLTALVARVLTGADGKARSIDKALAYLREQTDRFEEPYMLASLAIAAANANNADVRDRALSRLKNAAHVENGMAYWDLQANTPFYGWGLAGRLETTGLAIQALASRDASAPLVDQGLLFLLRNKDRFGVWHSTQATVNVLRALLLLAGKSASDHERQSLEVVINGHLIRALKIPASKAISEAIRIDLSPFLNTGANRIEFRSSTDTAATLQIVEKYFLPWTAESEENSPTKAASSLALKVKFDRTNANAGADIECHVEAHRIGFRGYGMMLAEIGLPPGAEVDRESLDRAMKSGNWDLYRYDVLPDRLIAYVWPRAGGTQFDFKFRVRYGINALAATSTLYDYYNPDAHVTLKPARFEIKSAGGL